MRYNGTLITILAICVIVYSFYHYNKDFSGLVPDHNVTDGARYHIIIDPERTDLSWYEKLIIKYAKRKNEKLQKSNQTSSTDDNNNKLEDEDLSSIDDDSVNDKDNHGVNSIKKDEISSGVQGEGSQEASDS